MQGKKRQFIFGLIGLGCGIVLSGILNLLLVLNTAEYKNGITLSAGQMTHNVLEDESREEKLLKSSNLENIQSKQDKGEEIGAHSVQKENVTNSGTDPVQSTEHVEQKETDKVTVTIPPKMTATKICDILEAAGVVEDAKDFKDYITEKKMTTKINEGTFVLSKNMSYNELLDKLMIH